MTRDEAATLIRSKLSFRASSTNLNLAIVNALQYTQRDLEMGKTLPPFLITESEALTGVANSPTIALPTGFLRLVEDENIWWNGTATAGVRELQRAEYKQLRAVWAGTTETSPRAYALRKNSIYIFPTPDVAHTYVWSYYKKADILDDGSDENVWLLNAPDLMIAQAGLLVAADLQDDAAVAKFTALQMSAQKAFFYKIVDDELADYPLIMGGNN